MARSGPVSLAVKRQWAILRLIPRAPRRIDGGRLRALLAQEGIEVTMRSIQRDLESLSGVFLDLSCDDRTKPYGWSWDGQLPLLAIPNLDVRSAVTFELARQYLPDVLPRTTLRTLDPYFSLAREVLKQNPQAKMTRWPNKVRAVPRGQPFLTPNVSAAILDPVYEALLEERQLRVWYRKRGARHATQYELNPLGLVPRSGTLVLVCTTGDDEVVKQMLLHRMRRVERIDRAATLPRGFRLDEHIASGALGFVRGGSLQLRALFDERVAVSLHEAPISRDQRLEPHSEGWELLQATVPDTVELRTWLQGHGCFVEVLGPKALREEFGSTAQALAKRYRAPIQRRRKAGPALAKGRRGPGRRQKKRAENE